MTSPKAPSKATEVISNSRKQWQPQWQQKRFGERMVLWTLLFLKSPTYLAIVPTSALSITSSRWLQPHQDCAQWARPPQTAMSACKAAQSCLTLWPYGLCSPPGSSVCGILQARIQEWVAISSPRGSSWLRDCTHISYVSCIGRLVLYHGTTVEAPNCNNCIYLLQLRWFTRLVRRESTEWWISREPEICLLPVPSHISS